MPSSKVITALDIGSSKIRAVVGVVEDKKSMINVIGVGTSPSAGMRKGVVSDLDEAVANITTALEEAERMSGEAIHRAFISFSGPSLETYDSKGVIAIGGANSEISENDFRNEKVNRLKKLEKMIKEKKINNKLEWIR